MPRLSCVLPVLPAKRFVRIHKSFLVALSRTERGKVQVGDTCCDAFAELIQMYNKL